MDQRWSNILWTLGGIFVVCMVLASVILLLIDRQLRRISLPSDADFWTTLRAVPFALVLALDLLDLGLDVLAAPLVWVLLSRYRLQALRNVAITEALVPLTQALPTFTVSWFAARALGLGQPPTRSQRGVIDTDQVDDDRYAPRTGRR